MAERFLQAGRITSTHGVRGELRMECWCDGPEFLLGVKRLYIGEVCFDVQSSRPHKNMLLVKLGGIDDVNTAMSYKGRVVCFDRNETKLPEGRHYISDLIGLSVVDAETGDKIGRLADVLLLPAGEVYVVRGEDNREYMIPAVPAFIEAIDMESGRIRVRMIEGMQTDAD